MSLVAEAFVTQLAAAEPWPENAALYQQLKEEQILLSDNASSLAVQTDDFSLYNEIWTPDYSYVWDKRREDRVFWELLSNCGGAFSS